MTQMGTMPMGTRPLPFPGTLEQLKANWATHNFSWDEDARCFDCDSRMGSVSAGWPCGAQVPRVSL